MPFTVEAIPKKWQPNIERTGVPTASGFITSAIQLLAGNGGLLLDVVFQKSLLDRKTTVATKAMAQSFTHLMRMAYYIPLGGMGDAMPLWGYAAGDRADDRRHVARRDHARAHDRRRLPALDAKRDLRGQQRLSAARGLAVLAGSDAASLYWLAQTMRAIHSTSRIGRCARRAPD